MPAKERERERRRDMRSSDDVAGNGGEGRRCAAGKCVGGLSRPVLVALPKATLLDLYEVRTLAEIVGGGSRLVVIAGAAVILVVVAKDCVGRVQPERHCMRREIAE